MAEREKFSSRMGFILISAGCAIGLGNVWRFPYIVGQYGGAAFVLLYLIFLVVLGLPIVVMEFSVGRASQKSAAMSFDVLEPKGKMCIRDRNFSVYQISECNLHRFKSLYKRLLADSGPDCTTPHHFLCFGRVVKRDNANTMFQPQREQGPMNAIMAGRYQEDTVDFGVVCQNALC